MALCLARGSIFSLFAILAEPTRLTIPSVSAGEDNFMISSYATSHDDLVLVVRSGGITHRVPAQFVAPGDVAGVKFLETNGTGEVRQISHRGICLPQSTQLMAALPVLQRHVATQQPLEMDLCRKDNSFPSLFMAKLSRTVNGFTYQKIES